jgi:hypothetical protein
VSWRIETTAEFDGWVDDLAKDLQDRVAAGVALLREAGPAAGRPLVDSIKGSSHSNMKEMRTGTIRVLFAFDPHRTAILLVGGDKRGQWESWYRRAIPRADRLLDQHLLRLGRRKRRGHPHDKKVKNIR